MFLNLSLFMYEVPSDFVSDLGKVTQNMKVLNREFAQKKKILFSIFVSGIYEKLFLPALWKLALCAYWLEGDILEKSAKANFVSEVPYPIFKNSRKT